MMRCASRAPPMLIFGWLNPAPMDHSPSSSRIPGDTREFVSRVYGVQRAGAVTYQTVQTELNGNPSASSSLATSLTGQAALAASSLDGISFAVITKSSSIAPLALRLAKKFLLALMVISSRSLASCVMRYFGR